ncbi:MAG: HK97 gp10 family phage protein, partial [Liquorilactobacillus satsumensis]
DLNEIYGMPKIKINGKLFYRTNGQPARQFLTPAINKVKDEAPEIVKARVNNALRNKLGGS